MRDLGLSVCGCCCFFVEGRLIMCGVCEVGWREGCVVKGVSVGVGEIRGVTN